MIYSLFEQKYTNLNRKYFHGQSKQKIPPKQEEYYLTNSFAYAFNYAVGYFGEVIEYNLKQIADIFNANSKKDAAVLRNFCKKYYPSFLPYIELLKTNDWTKIKNPEDKINLISIIQDLGYDGYFNWEVDKKMLDDYHDRGIYKWDLRENSPSIGIFNKKILIKRNVWDKDNYEQCKDFLKFKETELKIVKEKALKDKANYVDSKKTIDSLRRIILSIPYEQIKQVVEETTLKEAALYKLKRLKESEYVYNSIPDIYKIWPDVPTVF